MIQKDIRRHEESVTVHASPEALYDLMSDITRTGEWSPVCTSCWWDDEVKAGQVSAWFTGRNELPHRTSETRSEVVAAERGREFAWVVGGGFVRWGYTLTPASAGTILTESWKFVPGGIAMFEKEARGRGARSDHRPHAAGARRDPEDFRRDQADRRVHRRSGSRVMTGLGVDVDSSWKRMLMSEPPKVKYPGVADVASVDLTTGSIVGWPWWATRCLVVRSVFFLLERL